MEKENVKQNICSLCDKGEILNRLYHLRDFEIKHLWQRSIFLATFLVLLFTGYGAIIEKMLFCCRQELFNLIALSICLIGFVFSILWTMMAKGSKAWYEVYEQKIFILEKEIGIPDIYKSEINNTELKRKINEIGFNDCLFNTKGGKYSVSKINIIIGIILQIIWLVSFIIHAVFQFFSLYSCSLKCAVTIVLILIFAIFATLSYCNKIGCKSGSL